MDRLREALNELRVQAVDLAQPAFPLVVAVAAVLVALALHAIAHRVALRLTRRHDGFLRQALHRTRRQMRLASVLLGLAIVLPRARLDPFWGDLFGHISLILLIAFVGWTVMSLISYLAERAIRDLRIDAADNYRARKLYTQTRVLRQTANIVVFLITLGAVLLTFESVRQYGVSLFASAGAAGLVLGFAARPVLANLIAGIQIALTQPIRIEDVVIVEGEWGWVEEIDATYVVVRLWDWRRMIVPLSYFIETPFQNWTRQTARDHRHGDLVPRLHRARGRRAREARRGGARARLWDGQVVNLQVTEADKDTVTLRGLMSARTSPAAWDLRCEVRETMLTWLQAEYPHALPRQRAEISMTPSGAPQSA